MKISRIIFIITTIFLLLGFIIYFLSGNIIRKAFITSGTHLLEVPIQLKDVSVNPIKGRVGIESLTIGNPEQFKSEFAFQIEKFSLQLKPSSVLTNTIHVESISVDKAILISDGLTADNHRTLIRSLKEKQPSSIDSIDKASAEEPEPGSSKKFIIDHFSFTGCKLIVLVDDEIITTIDFPNIELDQIGKKGASVSLAEALTQIYGSIVSESTKILTINQDVIDALVKTKLKKIGIKDIKDLKNPERILKDPEKLNHLLDTLLQPKK